MKKNKLNLTKKFFLSVNIFNNNKIVNYNTLVFFHNFYMFNKIINYNILIFLKFMLTCFNLHKKTHTGFYFFVKKILDNFDIIIFLIYKSSWLVFNLYTFEIFWNMIWYSKCWVRARRAKVQVTPISLRDKSDVRL